MQSTSSRSDIRCALSARDSLYALAAGVVALALYVATLQPDLGGPEDTAKFQFLGYVLGTGHPPGYPLYVLLSHVFVQLPIRTIAYRANLFSAVMAGIACGLTYLLGRQIGAARIFAFCAALGLATGASFWRSAVFAEVYSLAAVMAALATALLLAWGARGSAGRLLGAVAASSLGLGNHLTIAGVAPAFLLYALLRNRRALSARVVGASVVVVLLGVSSYGFIVLRTRQRAPYLESSASTLPELVRVVTAEDFARQRFAFGPATVLTVQLPAVASVIGHELGLAGMLGLAAGLVAAVARRNSGAALLVGAAGGMLGMVVNLSGDIQGFVTPVMALLWPLAALGCDAIGRLVAPRVLRLSAGTLAVAAASAMPLANLAGNYQDADHSGDTAEARFLRSVYRQLPDRAGVVAESYWYDMRLQYLTLTGEGGPDRGIGPVGFHAEGVRKAVREGRRVFAFAHAATFLGAEGLRFERAPIVGPTLDDWIGTLPRGAVIVAASVYTPVPLELSGIERQNPRGLGQPRSFSAIVRIVGQSEVARVADDVPIAFGVEPGMITPRLPVFPGAVRVAVDERGARIVLAGRTIAQVPIGLAIAVFAPDGAMARAFTLQRDQPLRAPFEGALYELKGETPCVDITTNAWSDVTPVLSSGSWLATLPAIGSVVIESAFLVPRGVRTRSSVLLGEGAARITGRTRNADGTEGLLIGLTRSDESRPLFRLAVDSPAVARARLKPGGARASVRVCAQGMFPLFADGASHTVLSPDFESEGYFGAGWSDTERTATGRVRHADDRAATLLLPLQTGYEYQMTLDVVGAGPIDVLFNDRAVGSCNLRGPCEVALTQGFVRDGINTLTLSTQTGSAPARLTFQGAWILRHVSR